jgi:hypothetical protein
MNVFPFKASGVFRKNNAARSRKGNLIFNQKTPYITIYNTISVIVSSVFSLK